MSPWRATLIESVKYECEVYESSIPCAFICHNIELSTTKELARFLKCRKQHFARFTGREMKR